MIHTPNIQYREPEKSQMTNSSNINKVPSPIQMHKCIYIYKLFHRVDIWYFIWHRNRMAYDACNSEHA